MKPADNVKGSSPIPPLGTQGRWADIGVGAGLIFRAIGLMAKTPRLMLLSMVSALVAGLALVTMPFWLWSLCRQLVTHFITDAPDWHQFAVFALTLPNLILAPLQDPISEATEAACGQFEAPPFSVRAMVRGIQASLIHTGFRLFFMLLGLLVLAPLNFVPVIGSFAWWLLSSLWSMFWLSAEYLSGPMSRHLYRFSSVIRALRQRLALAMGFGGGLFILLWVPVLNFFLMPIAIVAATLLFRALRDIGVVETKAT